MKDFFDTLFVLYCIGRVEAICQWQVMRFFAFRVVAGSTF
jgi:hypothetical protein